MGGRYRLEGNNADTAARMLARVTAVLEERGIKYCLTAGTLLGIIRDGRLLPWDSDLDIRIFRQDLERTLSILWKIRMAGYLVRTKRQEKDDPPLVEGEVRIVKIYNRRNIVLKGEVAMDCFVARKDEDRYVWSCGGPKQYTKKAVPARFYDDLDVVNFMGKDYFIPGDHEAYLAHRYGDWRTPEKKWDFTRDDGAIIESNSP